MLHHPTPRITPENRDYFEACAAGRLVGERCIACGTVQCPPRRICRCTTEAVFEPIALSGKATIFSFSVIHRPAGPQFAEQVPYVLAMVDLAEGPRLMTNIVGADPDTVAIGQDVEVGFEPCEDVAFAVPVFAPVSGE